MKMREIAGETRILTLLSKWHQDAKRTDLSKVTKQPQTKSKFLESEFSAIFEGCYFKEI